MPLLHLAPFFLSAEPCAKPPQSLPHAMFSSIPIQKVQILLTKIFTLAHVCTFFKKTKESQFIENKVCCPRELSDGQTDGGRKKGLFLSRDFPFFAPPTNL